MNHPLHQIQVAFSQEEDRLQLRISTTAHEFRFWLTRRFVKLLWPSLSQVMEATVGLVTDVPLAQTSQAPTPTIKQEQADPAQPNPTSHIAGTVKETPLGPLPVLVAKAHIAPLPDGKYRVGLHPQDGNGIDMVIESGHLRALCSLLFSAVSKTDWDLLLSMPSDKHSAKDGKGVFCHVESDYKFN